MQAELRHKPKQPAASKKKPATASYEDRYQAVLKMRWIGYGSHEEIKRLRTNLRKAKTAITQLQSELQQVPAALSNPDADFVSEMLSALGHYDAALEKALREASRVKTKKDTEREEKERQRINAAIEMIFGDDTSLDNALSWIDALISLDGNEGRQWLMKKYGTENALVGFVGSVYDLKMIRKGNPVAIRQAVAKERLGLMENGRRSESGHGTYWHAGWRDVEAWRQTTAANHLT